ncbi:MAG: hypothetical protein HGA96_11115 [Desulfobulbaceae bacterium]|nr:hypothetical protein [Desulfobulbaceae bacterium]
MEWLKRLLGNNTDKMKAKQNQKRNCASPRVAELQNEANNFFARFTGTDTPSIDVRYESGLVVLSTLSNLDNQLRADAQTLSSMGSQLDQIVSQLFSLTSTYDSSRGSTPAYKANVREIGTLLGEAGGVHLMAAVGYRVMRKGCTEYSFSLSWDGVAGWMS